MSQCRSVLSSLPVPPPKNEDLVLDEDNGIYSPSRAELMALAVGPGATVATDKGRKLSRLLMGIENPSTRDAGASHHAFEAAGAGASRRTALSPLLSPPNPPASSGSATEQRISPADDVLTASELITNVVVFARENSRLNIIPDPNVTAFATKDPMDVELATARQAEWSSQP